MEEAKNSYLQFNNCGAGAHKQGAEQREQQGGSEVNAGKVRQDRGKSAVKDWESLGRERCECGQRARRERNKSVGRALKERWKSVGGALQEGKSLISGKSLVSLWLCGGSEKSGGETCSTGSAQKP